MIDKYNQIIATFDQERKQEEITIIDAKISAARKYLQSLLNQNDKLQATINNLEFNIDEAMIDESTIVENMKNIEFLSRNGIPASTQFFDYLSALEDQQSNVVAEIEANKKVYQNMYHQKIKLIQMNEGLSHLVESKKLKLRNLLSENRKLTDQKLELEDKMEKKENEYQEIVLTAVRLQNELEKKTGSLVGYDSQIENLKIKHQQALELLETKQRELKDAQKRIDQSEIIHQKVQQQRKTAQTKLSSINQWKSSRSELSNSIKKAKEEYFKILSNLDYYQRKDNKLSEKIQNLLGGQDLGDGTGKLAMQYIQTEINEIFYSDDPEKNAEIMAERSYNSQLLQELHLIENSIKDFQDHKEKTFQALGEELDECTQDGYIKLLESEMKAMKTSVAQQI